MSHFPLSRKQTVEEIISGEFPIHYSLKRFNKNKDELHVTPVTFVHSLFQAPETSFRPDILFSSKIFFSQI